MSTVRCVGLDVHAETIAVAVAEPDGEVRSLGEKMCQQSPATPLLTDTESSTSAPGTLGAAFDIAPYDGAQASTNWRKTSGEWQPGRSAQEQTVVRRCVDQ